MKIRCETTKRREASTVNGPSKFEVILIQEGLGNFGDCFYYTAEAIKSAAGVFNGKKIYMNHPSEAEEQDRPERSVKDIKGHFENVRAVESKDGHMQLIGVVVIPPGEAFDEARGLMQHAIEYAKEFSDQDFIGLSINASGDAEEMELDEVLKSAPEPCRAKLETAKSMGIDTVRATQKITDAVSCDLVTEAGAGGKILKMLESAKEKSKMGKKIAKESKKKVKEAEGEGDDAGHADAGKDKELIKSMLDKHVGKDAHDDEDAECMKQAIEAYKEMGMESEAAHEAAGQHVKAAKIMKQKQGEAENEDEGKEDADGDSDDDVSAKPAAPGKKKPADKEEDESEADESKEDESESEESEEKKESAKKVVKLTAENAVLKERLAKHDLEKHIEKKLSESGLPRKYTDKIREAAKDSKSAAEFEKILKVFSEARKLAESDLSFSDTFETPEKTVTADGEAGSAISFADSAED